MHRALSVPEILNAVLCLVDTFTLLSVARVCRLWNDQVTPMIWEFADARIFVCLAAMYEDDELYELSFMDFDFIVSEMIWNRFLRNCALVRHFTTLEGNCDYRLSAASQTFLERLLQGIVLFPNLRSLYLCPTSVSPMLMSPSVTSLTWVLETSTGDVPTCKSILRDALTIQAHMPSIYSLTIVATESLDRHDAVFALLCSMLKHLRCVRLPVYTLPPLFFRSLSALSSLERVEICRDDIQAGAPYAGHRRDMKLWTDEQTMLHLGPFSSLRYLGLGLPDIEFAQRFFFHSGLPMTQISSLEFDIAFPSTMRVEHLRKLLSDLHFASSGLSSLSMTFVTGLQDPVRVATIEAIDLYAIQPIIRFAMLKELFICHTLPLMLSDEDTLTIAKGCPSLAILSLNPRPIVIGRPNMSIASISNFLRWCSDLQSISLYIDGGNIDGELMSGSLPFGRRLQTIDVGLSTFPLDCHPDTFLRVIQLLWRMIPEDCMLLAGAPDYQWQSDFFMRFSALDHDVTCMSPSALERIERFCTSWESIFSLLRSVRL